jgi:hypothetical protein
MLDNIHYIGKVKWNHRKTIKIVENGEVKKSRPVAKIGEFLIYEGKHDGIISEELFNAAQAKTGNNPRLKPNAKVRNPFAGLIWCTCGRAVAYRTYKQPDGSIKSAPRLLCMHQAYCNNGSVLYSVMEEKVCEVHAECISDFEVRVKNDEGDSLKLHTNLIKTLEKKKKELEAKELSQWEAQSHPDPSQRMPQHIFQKLNENLLKEKEEIQQALCKAYESLPEPVDYEEKIVRFTEALEALKNPDVSAEEKNLLLKACIDRMTMSCEKPVRITRKNCEQYGIAPDSLKTGGNWHTPNFELDVQLKM